MKLVINNYAATCPNWVVICHIDIDHELFHNWLERVTLHLFPVTWLNLVYEFI